MFKVNSRNTRVKCKRRSKLTTEIPEGGHWVRFGVFIVNYEHILHLVLVFILINLSRLMLAGCDFP